MIERMKHMKETLMNCVSGQLGDLSSVDAKELGEAMDMIKDLSEAIYYCTITEKKKKSDKEKKAKKTAKKSEVKETSSKKNAAKKPDSTKK